MNDPRPNAIARIFIELELIAQWATCQRGQVASALVDRHGVIRVPSRNGTPSGRPPCKTLTDGTERCIYCIHSEKNVINHAARSGVITLNQSIYTLKRPCIGCANDIIQAGIKEVVYREDYDTDGQFEYVYNLFRESNVRFIKHQITEHEKTFSYALEQWRFTTWDRQNWLSM